MATIRIKEMFPKYGVLAIGDVMLDFENRIEDVQLVRQTNTYKYKVIFPKSAGTIDSQLREKITDAMAYKYEKDSRNHSGICGSEQTTLQNKQRKNLRNSWLGSYKIRSY